MMQHLKDRTWDGARERFPNGVPDTVRQRLEHEFALIESLNYAAYFLTVDDIVAFARSNDILCQASGGANSGRCCYRLGVTRSGPPPRRFTGGAIHLEGKRRAAGYRY